MTTGTDSLIIRNSEGSLKRRRHVTSPDGDIDPGSGEYVPIGHNPKFFRSGLKFPKFRVKLVMPDFVRVTENQATKIRAAKI